MACRGGSDIEGILIVRFPSHPLLLAFLATALVGITACTGSPDEPGEEWPMSGIELPDTASLGGVEPVDGVMAGRGEVAATGDMAVSEAALADTADSRVDLRENGKEGASSGNQSEAASTGPLGPRPYSRPQMNIDASGPMIHTQPLVVEDFPDARFPRPQHVRGLYMNAWASGSNKRMTEILDVARETEINSLVIDIKDATGYISHETTVPLALEIGADQERRIRDLPALLNRLEAEGIYPIARIVVVKDPILSAGRPEFAVQDTAGGIWVDRKETIWMNPYSRGLWEYNVTLAREVAEMGFPEIQWDYIRFPDAPQSDMNRAVFEGSEDMERVDAIRGFLSYAREELSDLPVRTTADVFGVTTSFRRDIGIGQLWETFIDVVDVALPMVYPSHYWEDSFGYDKPNAYPYEIVLAALRDALRRSARVDGAGMTRPWLQDFSLGQPIYGGPEVRAQIQATYDIGIQEWILWNASTRYTISALEPVTGFATDPLVRVAGVLTPVSRRYEVMDSVAALHTDTATTVSAVVDDVPVDTIEVVVTDTLFAGTRR
jgi:hypothetical protein